MDFDLESLVNVEQSFYDEGYQDGFAHGQIHGLIEGRELGREKGFEMWEELGFYEGFALMWRSIHEAREENNDRISHNIKHLLELISQFPRINPSATGSSDLDIPRLFRQIRSRYKALCATLGIKPILRASVSDATEEAAEDPGNTPPTGDLEGKSNRIWTIDSARAPRSSELSF